MVNVRKRIFVLFFTSIYFVNFKNFLIEGALSRIMFLSRIMLSVYVTWFSIKRYQIDRKEYVNVPILPVTCRYNCTLLIVCKHGLFKKIDNNDLKFSFMTTFKRHCMKWIRENNLILVVQNLIWYRLPKQFNQHRITYLIYPIM